MIKELPRNSHPGVFFRGQCLFTVNLSVLLLSCYHYHTPANLVVCSSPQERASAISSDRLGGWQVS